MNGMYYTIAAMRRFGLGIGMAILATVAACDATGGAAGPDSASLPTGKIEYENGHALSLPNSDPGVAVFEAELLRLVNDHRLGLGLSPLVPSTRLSDAARAHSRHMIEHRFFGHATPEGQTPSERLTLANLDWNQVGENIAAGYSTPQGVFDAWMASPEHRANMESDGFTYAGIGYAQDAAPTADFPQVHYWAMALLRR